MDNRYLLVKIQNSFSGKVTELEEMLSWLSAQEYLWEIRYCGLWGGSWVIIGSCDLNERWNVLSFLKNRVEWKSHQLQLSTLFSYESMIVSCSLSIGWSYDDFRVTFCCYGKVEKVESFICHQFLIGSRKNFENFHIESHFFKDIENFKKMLKNVKMFTNRVSQVRSFRDYWRLSLRCSRMQFGSQDFWWEGQGIVREWQMMLEVLQVCSLVLRGSCSPCRIEGEDSMLDHAENESCSSYPDLQ